MSKEISLPPELLRRVFPCYLAISPALQVLDAGPVLRRLLPALEEAPHFAEVFSLERPALLPDFEALRTATGTVVILSVKHSQLTLRGEFLAHPDTGVLLFIGSPRLLDFAELAPLGLSLQDFAVHDPVQDFLYAAQAQRAALAEARALTAQLQKKQQELKQLHQAATGASRLKTELLTNMSHEVRTPLHAIIGLSQLLLESSLSKEQREQLLTMNIESKHLLTLFTNLLELSSLVAGGLKPTAEVFDLWSLAESTLSPFAEAALHKDLTLLCRISPETPRLVEGDPVLLRLSLTHLIQNALKFTERGEITLRLQYQHDACTFDVLDSGIGLQIDSPETLFTPFSQGDSSSTRRFGGMGLGLAIVAEIAKMLHGETGCEDRPEGGSRFWLTLPCKPQAYEQPRLPLRLLLVEPNRYQRESLQETLSSLGARVTAASHAADARRHCQQAERPFEVIIAHEQDLAFIQETKQQSPPPHAILLRDSRHPQPHHEETLPLPLRLTQLLDRLAACALRQPRRPPPSGSCVLVVEDNPVNQKLAKLFLENLGYQVDQATDGDEAIAAAKKTHYAAILMDCQMPRCDGYEATRAIRAHETHPRTPIIAMTANVTRGAKAACLQAGMDDYLPKPVQLLELQQMLERWAKEKSAEHLPLPTPLTSSILDQLRAISPHNGDEIVSEIVSLYLRDSQRNLSLLRRALAEDATNAALHTAHSLKGSSGNVGANTVSKVSAQLEAALKQNNLPAARDLLPKLEREFKRAELALSKLLR